MPAVIDGLRFSGSELTRCGNLVRGGTKGRRATGRLRFGGRAGGEKAMVMGVVAGLS